MEINFGTRLKHAWNAFMGRDPTYSLRHPGIGYSYRPDIPMFTRGNERSIITALYNRIAIDAASINVRHIRLNDQKRYDSDMKSDLNYCLETEANIDQTGRELIQDIVMSMLDEGCVAVIPVDTDDNVLETDSYEIYTLRTGRIVAWYPDYIRVKAYNELTGEKEEIDFPKSQAAIIENPFYSVMNEPNSTLQRLIRKLNMLDAIDEQSSSGKLDLIIQLPYTIKTEARQLQAEKRRQDITEQLTGSKYGIAYTDATEHITQLNRPIENNLLSQIEYLTNMLYSQLGITQGVLDGTADDKVMTNYYTRTIGPIMTAITEEMNRKFLTKTARTQGQSIVFFNDPFRLVPVSQLPDIIDKFTRNEVMTSNEFRQIMGLKPSDDPNADELRNKNISQSSDDVTPHVQTSNVKEEFQNG